MNLQATATAGIESIRLAWTPSTTEGLGGFLVHWREKGETAWDTEELPASDRAFTIARATPGVVLEWQVRALLAGPLASGTATPAAKVPISNCVIGVNGGSVHGAQYAKQLVLNGIRSERLEGTAKLSESYANGFTNQTVIVGNIPDATSLAAVDRRTWLTGTIAELKLLAAWNASTPVGRGILFAEVINEPQFKGGHADPVTYAAMYVELKQAAITAGINIPLGFTIFGNYQRPNGQWAYLDWIGDAVTAQPALPKLTDCLVHHTYGRVSEDIEENLGTKALEDEHARAIELGFPAATYVTEMGFQWIVGQTNYKTEPTEAGQAAGIASVITRLLELGYVKGIWPYAVLDGAWSFTTASLITVESFAAVPTGAHP